MMPKKIPKVCCYCRNWGRDDEKDEHHCIKSGNTKKPDDACEDDGESFKPPEYHPPLD